jgi:pyruvate dehydrogenase E1 component
MPYSANTPYLNTIPVDQEEYTPGDPGMEWRIRSLIRWNALAMVVKANRITSELGGHIASFASSATLYDVGFNHFWHAPGDTRTAAIWCSSRAIPRRASTPAPIWKAG